MKYIAVYSLSFLFRFFAFFTKQPQTLEPQGIEGCLGQNMAKKNY